MQAARSALFIMRGYLGYKGGVEIIHQPQALSDDTVFSQQEKIL